MIPTWFQNDPKMVPRPPPHPWLGQEELPRGRNKSNETCVWWFSCFLFLHFFEMIPKWSPAHLPIPSQVKKELPQGKTKKGFWSDFHVYQQKGTKYNIREHTYWKLYLKINIHTTTMQPRRRQPTGRRCMSVLYSLRQHDKWNDSYHVLNNRTIFSKRKNNFLTSKPDTSPPTPHSTKKKRAHWAVYLFGWPHWGESVFDTFVFNMSYPKQLQ